MLRFWLRCNRKPVCEPKEKLLRMFEIRVNGELRRVTGGTVQDVLGQLGVEAEALLVEHNGVALHRREWMACDVSAGDVLELVRIVAGG